MLQNLSLLEKTKPDFILILSSDHVYKMDYRSLLRHHIQSGAAVTVSALEWPRTSAQRFGVLETDRQGRIVAFEEKPVSPSAILGRPARSLINMGIYVFNTQALIGALKGEAEQDMAHDFGKNVLPRIANAGRAYVYNFTDTGNEHGAYWRDVGSIDSYYQAAMEFLVVDSRINFFENHKWRLEGFGDETAYRIRLETNTVVAQESAVCDSALLAHSVISANVRVNWQAEIQHSILMPGASVGRRAKIRRAIIGENARIPEGAEVGFDHRKDAGYGVVTESGIVVIPSDTIAV